MARFALMTYKTTNLGDDVQSFAARQYLPKVDFRIDRDEVNAFVSGGGPVSMILNGWFMDKPWNWPPSRDIRPLFIAVHLGKHCRSKLASIRYFEYYKMHEPIGCRDYATVCAFEAIGIRAYYSGCLTLTLPPAPTPTRDRILFCDPFGADVNYRFYVKGDEYYDWMLDRMFGVVSRDSFDYVSHDVAQSMSSEDRLSRAGLLLERYANARCVITSRIHCALPCLAFGTPVLFVIPRRGSDMRLGGLVGAIRWWWSRNRLSDQRFPGLVDLMRSIRIQDIEARNSINFDIFAPPTNPACIREISDALRGRCEEFVRSAV